MTHAPTGATIVFNGEIYNFRRLRVELEGEGEIFRTGSDTEVLLAGLVRHGEAYLDRLEGMYAFALFDPRSGSVLLARDPAGIKPLYIATGKAMFAFASEVRAILATGIVAGEIDRRAIAGFLAYGALQHPLTLFEGIRSLNPGSCLTVGVAPHGGWEITRPQRAFWRLPETWLGVTEDQAVEAVREKVEMAVKDHLVADVPVGLFLSSGIDSTILAGIASRHTSTFQSFSVGFADYPEFCELRLAAQTARHFGLNHTEIQLPMKAAEGALTDWLAASDQPSIDGLNVYVISRAVRERGIKVALSGLGADELFGGYPSFRDVPRIWQVNRLTRSLPAGLGRGLAAVATLGRSRAVHDKLRDMLQSDGSIRSLYLHRRRVMSDSQLSLLGISAFELGLDANFLPPDATFDVDAKDGDPVRLISQLEFRLYQGNMLLPDADVNSMAHGLEIRVPFLDQRLLDLAHALPGPIRLPAGIQGKHLLRRAFADLLPRSVVTQRKRGFTLPIAKWLAGSLRPRCESAIDALKGSGVLSQAGIESVWRLFLNEPDSQMWTRALALVVLGEFVQKSASTTSDSSLTQFAV